jgi:trigger factor
VALEFSITGQELAAAEERAFRKLVKNVRLPGFRKGKVPRKIFEQAYGSNAVTSQAVDEVVPEVYAKAIREHDLEPVERPKLEVLEESEGRPTRLKATVEVRPQIDLGKYKGITVSRPAAEVTDADVDRSLATLARERATLVPVERPARLGDVVTLDYEGTIDEKPFAGGKGVGEVAELTQGRFVPGFAEGIVDMSPGETKIVDAQFPEGYPAAELAGKPARFTITLRELKELELPPLDDEFAKAFSNQTVAELRADLRRRLEAIAASRARREVGNAVMAQLLASHDFPLPPSMVENELNYLLEELATSAGAANVEEHRGRIGKSEEEQRAEYRAEAESRVKAALFIEQIAKEEKIAATPADIAAELEVLSRRYGQPVARVRRALGNNLLSLMEGIVRNKTLDFLVDNAEVVVDQETPRSTS